MCGCWKIADATHNFPLSYHKYIFKRIIFIQPNFFLQKIIPPSFSTSISKTFLFLPFLSKPPLSSAFRSLKWGYLNLKYISHKNHDSTSFYPQRKNSIFISRFYSKFLNRVKKQFKMLLVNFAAYDSAFKIELNHIYCYWAYTQTHMYTITKSWNFFLYNSWYSFKSFPFQNKVTPF